MKTIGSIVQTCNFFIHLEISEFWILSNLYQLYQYCSIHILLLNSIIKVLLTLQLGILKELK